jgi:hypothetical protein
MYILKIDRGREREREEEEEYMPYPFITIFDIDSSTGKGGAIYKIVKTYCKL